MSPYGTCPDHGHPNIAGGRGCWLCEEDRQKEAERKALVTENARLKAALGLPDGPTRAEVAAAYLEVPVEAIEALLASYEPCAEDEVGGLPNGFRGLAGEPQGGRCQERRDSETQSIETTCKPSGEDARGTDEEG